VVMRMARGIAMRFGDPKKGGGFRRDCAAVGSLGSLARREVLS
jgi:hypothetical protein